MPTAARFVRSFCNTCGSPVAAGDSYCSQCQTIVPNSKVALQHHNLTNIIVIGSAFAILLAWYLAGDSALTIPLIVIGQIGLYVGLGMTKGNNGGAYAVIVAVGCAFALLLVYMTEHRSDDRPFFWLLWLSVLALMHFSVRRFTAKAWPWTLIIVALVGLHQAGKLGAEYYWRHASTANAASQMPTIWIKDKQFGEKQLIGGHYRYGEPVLSKPCVKPSELNQETFSKMILGCSAIVWLHDATGLGSIHFINWSIPRTVAEGDSAIADEIAETFEKKYPKYVLRFDTVASGPPRAAKEAPIKRSSLQYDLTPTQVIPIRDLPDQLWKDIGVIPTKEQREDTAWAPRLGIGQVPELLISSELEGGCGSAGCPYSLYGIREDRTSDGAAQKKYKPLLSGFGGFTILRSVTNGYKDLMVETHDSVVIMQFDGRIYHPARCFSEESKSADELHPEACQ